MFSARWAHRALLGICLLLTLAVVLYAGWEGWLTESVRSRLRALFDPILQKIPHPDLLDRLARVLGAIGTVMTAAFGVYKGIYYADRNLPERLKQLLAKANQKILADRQPLLSVIADSRPGSLVPGSIFHVEPLNRALREINLSNVANAGLLLREALDEIKKQIGVSDCHRRNLEEQCVAAHILRGSIASARAEEQAQSGNSPEDDRHLAEVEFTEALKLRRKDVDALELRGRQRELRGNLGGAIEDYRALGIAARAVADTLRVARAHRLQGELFERQATRPKLAEARQMLDAGLTAIGVLGSLGPGEQGEKARLLLAHGRVQLQRTRRQSAKKSLEGAVELSSQLKSNVGLFIGQQAAELLRSLKPAEDTAPIDTNRPAEKSGWLSRWFA